MLLDIRQQREIMLAEVALMRRFHYKLSSQMRHFKHFNEIPMIFRATRSLLARLETVQTLPVRSIASLDILPYISRNQWFRRLLLRKGLHAHRLLGQGVFLQFCTMALGCLARLTAQCRRIGKKLAAIERVLIQLRGASP